MLPQGIQLSFQAVSGRAGLLSRHCMGNGPHLTLRGESLVFLNLRREALGSAPIVTMTSEPLMLPQGSQASFKVARATSGFLSSCCSGIRLHLELRQETQGSSPVATGISGWLSSFTRGVWLHIMLRHGIPLSSQVVNSVLNLLFKSDGELRLFLEVQRGL